MDFRVVYEHYRSDLQRVESILHESVQSHTPRLTESSTKLLEAGGKRIRPLFAIICSRTGNGIPDAVYQLASALELIHMATLVHDDVIDDAMVRRGAPTVKSQYGNRAAMYTGDFLFARAIELLTSIPDTYVHTEMSSAMVRMCQGEIEQIRDFYDWRQSFRNYLRRIERKTALLISVSCALGAYLGGASTKVVKAMKRFGYYTGMAFQVIDDILDFTGDERVVGKPVGGDLRQGNITLPALYAAACDGYADRLSNLVHSGADESALNTAIEIVRSSNGLSFAKECAQSFMKKAMRELEHIGEPMIRTELQMVAEFVNQRMY
jgi:heptaprenyl diphosphate synthase